LVVEIEDKYFSMSHHAHLKNERIAIRPLASVIPNRFIREKNSKQHVKDLSGKAKKDIPLFYTKPIFKAKKHDPL
jgi:hypothetical protein